MPKGQQMHRQRPKRSAKGRMPPKALTRRATGSQTYFKDNVGPKNYSFEGRLGWKYRNKQPVYREGRGFTPAEAFSPATSEHWGFVLRDGHNAPRVALEYDDFGSAITIYSIQRERTQYKPSAEHAGFFKWDVGAEKRAQGELKQQLGGMHPSEFLLSEFLYRNRANITGGKPVYLKLKNPVGINRADLAGMALKNHRGLIERFFEKKPEEREGWLRFKLNMKKERVRQILGIK